MSRRRSLLSHDGSVINYRFPKKRIAVGPRSNSEYHPVVEARRNTTEISILNVGCWPRAEVTAETRSTSEMVCIADTRLNCCKLSACAPNMRSVVVMPSTDESMNQKRLKVFVSGYLGGAKIRYNGSGVEINHEIWRRWEKEERLHHFCPELAAGLPVPRPAAEIFEGTAADVLDGKARVMEDTGADATEIYVRGAQMAVKEALALGVAAAVLTDGSPTCGSTFQYSGYFDGETKPGNGVLAESLLRAGIMVFPHTDLEAADEYLRSIEHQSKPPG